MVSTMYIVGMRNFYGACTGPLSLSAEAPRRENDRMQTILSGPFSRRKQSDDDQDVQLLRWENRAYTIECGRIDMILQGIHAITK